jgi:hypothetical protein
MLRLRHLLDGGPAGNLISVRRPAGFKQNGGRMPETEPLGYTTGERVAGLIGLLVLVGLGLICMDLASGGRLARFLEPEQAQVPDE